MPPSPSDAGSFRCRQLQQKPLCLENGNTLTEEIFFSKDFGLSSSCLRLKDSELITEKGMGDRKRGRVSIWC